MNKIIKTMNAENRGIKKDEFPKSGFYDEFGGQYVPDSLRDYLDKLDSAYAELRNNPEFQDELENLLRDYVGRPSPLYYASKMSKMLGFKIYLKREDLNHTGAHKINNALGQGLLAKYMGKKEIIAETGAGQHGVATATVSALFGMKCKIFMGEIDAIKQKTNVERMQLLGAEVVIVKAGGKTLKDAVDEALGYLIKNPDVFYLLGSVVGPHPYPMIVRDFQRIIGNEAKKQILQKENRLPDYLVACVGGGSNAMGLFYEFADDADVKLIGVEPAGKGIESKRHAATLTLGTSGIIHGFKCYLLKDKDGNPADVYSIASGLDYPGVGPEISMLKKTKRMSAECITDDEAIFAFKTLSMEEGIIPALESSHAIAYLIKNKDKFRKDDLVILNLSGRGDKDLQTVLSLSDG